MAPSLGEASSRREGDEDAPSEVQDPSSTYATASPTDDAAHASAAPAVTGATGMSVEESPSEAQVAPPVEGEEVRDEVEEAAEETLGGNQGGEEMGEPQGEHGGDRGSETVEKWVGEEGKQDQTEHISAEVTVVPAPVGESQDPSAPAAGVDTVMLSAPALEEAVPSSDATKASASVGPQEISEGPGTVESGAQAPP